jgi:hypothetical protein
MNPPKWTLRAIIVAAGVLAAVAAAPRAGAQPQANPFRAPPGFGPVNFPGPLFPGQPRAPVVINQPQFNVPGFRFNPDPFGNNPRLNPVQFVPVNALQPNPFFVNPFLVNPFNNPFAANNPFALVNNPLNNPFHNPLNNPFVANPFGPNPFASPFAPAVFTQPALAIQQPGFLRWAGPDLQLNPWSGTAVKPSLGVAQTADGRVFFQLGRDGIPTVFNPNAPRTGVFVDPTFGTFLNPRTGVIVQPGGTRVFLPWIP